MGRRQCGDGLWRAWEIIFRGPVFSPEGSWKPQRDFKEEKSLLDFHSRTITLAQCGRWIEREGKVTILGLAEPNVLL